MWTFPARCDESPPAAFARGFACFGATYGAFAAFLQACRRTGLVCERFIASQIRPRTKDLPHGCRAVAVFQDLPLDSPLLSPLTQHVIFPAWFRGVPLCFFSLPERAGYPGRNPRAVSLHSDLDGIVAFLLREQLTCLLEMCSDGKRAGSVSSAQARPIPLDEDLDASQSGAAAHGRGPMRVLAPAGSGKTRTLVNRICALVNAGIDAGHILALAFNRKAAAEMSSRLLGKGLGCVQARTFHSLGYEIVRAASRLVFEAESEASSARTLLLESFETLGPERAPGDGNVIERSLRLLSTAKRDLLPLESMTLDLKRAKVPFGQVFTRFLQLQEERGFMTYDDMIYFALRLLLDNDALRRKYQEQYAYLLVDEFQDLNRAQILLLEILALPENNLFVVGDDDQLIYGWRGASVRSILDFPRLHPCARESVLSTNYRSSARIVAHAGSLIGRNRERAAKAVRPRADAPQGEFSILLGTGLWEQAQMAADWIARKEERDRWQDTAVLFRYNALEFTVALALDRKCIPHTDVSPGRLFDSRPGKDITAWLKVLLLPEKVEREDLERILRRPVPLLRRSLIAGLGSWHEMEILPGNGAMTEKEEHGVRELLAIVRGLRAQASLLSTCTLIDEIDRTLRLRMSYARVSKVPSDPDEADDATYMDVIYSVSQTLPHPSDFLAYIMESPAQTQPTRRADELPSAHDQVVLSTIHRAKGNEFARVVLFDLSRRRRPGALDPEEERRVTYVALTRAKESLLVTANGRRQSPFLREAALDPQFAGRMREDMESELAVLRRRLRRCRPGHRGAVTRMRIIHDIEALEEELRCRAMLSLLPVSP